MACVPLLETLMLLASPLSAIIHLITAHMYALQISSDMHHPNKKRMSLVLQDATARCATGKIFFV